MTQSPERARVETERYEYVTEAERVLLAERVFGGAEPSHLMLRALEDILRARITHVAHESQETVWHAGREAGFRDALIALAERRGLFFDSLESDIADSLRRDTEYVEEQTRLSRREALADLYVRLAPMARKPVGSFDGIAEVRRLIRDVTGLPDERLREIADPPFRPASDGGGDRG